MADDFRIPSTDPLQKEEDEVLVQKAVEKDKPTETYVPSESSIISLEELQQQRGERLSALSANVGRDERGYNDPYPYPEAQRTDITSHPHSFSVPEEEDPSLLADAGRGVLYGGYGFVESVIDLGADVGNVGIWIAEKLGLNEEGGFRFSGPELNEQFTPKTFLGGAIGGMTQLVAGFAAASALLAFAAPAGIAALGVGGTAVAVGGAKLASVGRFGRFLKWAAFSKKDALGRARRGMTLGAMADFIAFKEHEERFSNFIQNTSLANPISEYLASDKSDNWLEGRLKNTLEGMGLGALAEVTIFLSGKLIKNVRKSVDEGDFKKADQIIRNETKKFEAAKEQILSGKEVLVLHNEDTLRQYLTIVPGMDPAKLESMMVFFKTLANVHSFDSINSFLSTGQRTTALSDSITRPVLTGAVNRPLPSGVLGSYLPEVPGKRLLTYDEGSVFERKELLEHGMEGPLGDGTPYALFEVGSNPGIKEALEKEGYSLDGGSGGSVTTHTRKYSSGSEEVLIIQGMTVEKAKILARKIQVNSVVTSQGIHSLSKGTVRPLSAIRILEEGDESIGGLRFTAKDEFGVVREPVTVEFEEEMFYRDGQTVEDFQPRPSEDINKIMGRGGADDPFERSTSRGFVKGKPLDLGEGFAIEMKPTKRQEVVDRGQDAIEGVDFRVDEINPDDVTKIYHRPDFWVKGDEVTSHADLEAMKDQFPNAEVIEVRLSDDERTWTSTKITDQPKSKGDLRYALDYGDSVDEWLVSDTGDRAFLAQESGSKYRETESPFDTPEGAKEFNSISRADQTSLQEVFHTDVNVNLNNIENAIDLLGDAPFDSLKNVTNFLMRQKDRVLSGRMTVKQMVKGSVMTTGSNPGRAKSWKDVSDILIKEEWPTDLSAMKAQFDEQKRIMGKDARPEEFSTFSKWMETVSQSGSSWKIDVSRGGKEMFDKSKYVGESGKSDMLTSEDYMSLWLMSPNGKMALDALDDGKVLGDLWQEFHALRSAIGLEDLPKDTLIPKTITKEITLGGRTVGSYVPKDANNLVELEGVVSDFNSHLTRQKGKYDSDVMNDMFKRIVGRNDARGSFMKHLLGLGEASNINNQQVRYWLTGLMEGGTKDTLLEDAFQDIVSKRLLEKFTKAGEKGPINIGRAEALNKIKTVQEGFAKKMREHTKSPNTSNGDLTSNILHNLLWNKVTDAEGRLQKLIRGLGDDLPDTLTQRDSLGSIRAATSFANDGSMVMNIFTRKFSDIYGREYGPSDIGSVIHELAHMYRRAMMDPIGVSRNRALGKEVPGYIETPSYLDDLTKIEEHLGIKDGKWTRRDEELFVEGFEQWILGGAKVEGLEKEFANMKNWMGELYRNMHDSPVRDFIQPHVTAVFSRIFGKEGLPIHLTASDHTKLSNLFREEMKKPHATIEDGLEEVGLNLRNWSIDTDSEDAFRAVSKFIKDEKILEGFKNQARKDGEGGMGITKDSKGNPLPADVQKNAYTLGKAERLLGRNLGSELGLSEDALRSQLSKTATATENVSEHLVAGKMLLASYGKTMYQMAEKVTKGVGGDYAAASLMILQEKFLDVYSSVLRINRSSARAVQSGNIPIKGLSPDVIDQLIQNKGGLDSVRKFARDILLGNHGKGIASFAQLRKMSKSRFAWDVIHEVRINGLLSSFKSLSVDLISTMQHLFLLPFERMTGAFVMGNRALVREGFSYYVGYSKAMKDSISLSAKAMWQEQPILDPLIRTTETAQHALSSARVKEVFPNTNNVLAGAIDFLGRTVIRWPSRLRLGSKEFYDQMAFRGHLYKRLTKEALEKFDPKTQSDLISKYVVDNMEKGFDDLGRGIEGESLKFAREVNYAEPLMEGLGAAIQRLKYNHPWVGLILPFVRTPTHLFRGFIGRSFAPFIGIPGIGDMVATVNPILKTMREDFLMGGEKKAAVIGKMNTAVMLYGSAVLFASEGQELPGGKKVRVIGSGPPDPAQRRIWEKSGKLPNSLEITMLNGDRHYIQFDRLDPWWMFVGLAADYVQLQEFLTEDQQKDIVGFGFLALASRLDGAYLKGAIDAAGAWSQGGSKMMYFLDSMAKSFVPRVLSQNPLSEVPGLEGLDDPYKRETTAFHKAWMTVFPSLWNKFGIKYDAITGEPLVKQEGWVPGEGTFSSLSSLNKFSPFKKSVAKAKDNPLLKLTELMHGFSPPSWKKWGLDLREEEVDFVDDDGIQVTNAYQLWQKNIGKLPVKDVLLSITNNKNFDSLTRENKISVIRKALIRVRKIGLATMLRDHPDLANKLLAAKRMREHREAQTATRSL